MKVSELLDIKPIPAIAVSKGTGTIFAASISRFNYTKEAMLKYWLSNFGKRKAVDVESQSGLLAGGTLTLTHVVAADACGLKVLISVPDTVALSNLAFSIAMEDAQGQADPITFALKPLRKNVEMIILFGSKSGDRLYPRVTPIAMPFIVAGPALDTVSLSVTITGANNISVSTETLQENHPDMLELYSN